MLRMRQIKWMRTLLSGHLQFLIRWNPMPKKTFPRTHESQETLLLIRGEDELTFDVNEEAWPNADLTVRSSL